MIIRTGNRRHPDPWERRRHPYRYHPDALHEMLVDDGKRRKPLGGPMEKGAAFLIGACEKIAAHRRITVEDYFGQLTAEIAVHTGSTALPLA